MKGPSFLSHDNFQFRELGKTLIRVFYETNSILMFSEFQKILMDYESMIFFFLKEKQKKLLTLNTPHYIICLFIHFVITTSFLHRWVRRMFSAHHLGFSFEKKDLTLTTPILLVLRPL